MRVAVYNQMFGMNGRNLISFLTGHWAVHYQSDTRKIFKRVNLHRTFETIKQIDADIIGIIELLDSQQGEFKRQLKKMGYKGVYFGYGHRLKYSSLYVVEAIASKFPCRQLNLGKWPFENKMGGGGGLGIVYVPKIKATIFNAHLGLPSCKYYSEQMKFLSDKVNKTKGRVILMGDFNKSYDCIKEFFNIKLASGRIKSCSITSLIKLIHYRDEDHILVKGFKVKKFRGLNAYSDHKLIYADLR